MHKTILLLTLCFATAMAGAQTSSETYGTNKEGKQKITNGPVIEYVSDHSAMIAWSTKLAAGTYLAYGTDPNNLTQKSHKDWGGTNHRLEISNLQPSTTYYFQVRSENAKGTGDDVQSPVASFKTVAKGASPDRQNRNVGVNGSSSSSGSTVASSSGAATTNANANLVPLYRLYQASTGDHVYTTDASERSTLSASGYKYEGVVGYVAKTQQAGTVPLYELVGKAGNHLYTTSATEKSTAIARGYTDKGINGYIAQSQQSGTSPLYRMLGKNGNHLYTVSSSEKSSATSQGYRDEGITGYIWTQGSETVAQQ